MEIQRTDEGEIDLAGIQYELDAKLESESSIWKFGRVDQITILGDHRINLQRDTHSLVFFRQGQNHEKFVSVDGKKIAHDSSPLAGKIDVLPKGSQYTSNYVGGTFSATVMSIDPSLADLLPSSDGVLDLIPQTQLSDNFLRMMCEQFIHASDPLLRESLLMTLLVYLSRKSMEPQVSSGFHSAKKRKLIEYVEDHLEHPISISDLANQAAVSTFHFLRLFKLSFGITPYQYILQRRVERAKVLLTHTDDRIDTVGYKSGFSSASQFSQTFSRVAGISPSAFKKSLI